MRAGWNISRVLIEGLGSGNRLDQTGYVGCPACGLLAVSSSAAASWGTAGLISDASTLSRQPGEQLGGGDVHQLRAVLQVSVYNHGVRGIRPGGLGSLQVDFRADTRACSATILDPPSSPIGLRGVKIIVCVNYSPLYLTAL